MAEEQGSSWDELREAFLVLLRETGNAQQAARTLGHPNLFNNRRQTDPAFRSDWEAALAEADARLGRFDTAFPQPAPPQSPADPVSGDDLGGYLKPSRKRPQSEPEPVIRRTANGRLQITFAQEGHWTSEIEADFLARVRATGNVHASARAVGFHPTTIAYRMHKWASFARDIDEALKEASVSLEYRLVAHAHASLRTRAEPPPEGEDPVPFDPMAAMRIIGFIEARRHGRTGRGRRKGPPERTLDEAIKSILGKIAAIERHEALRKVREGDRPCIGGEGAEDAA